jgi:pyridoxine 5-phosphate synthase
LITTEFNIEGYPSKQFIDMVLEVMPKQVTLVPDPPGAITSNAGWDTIKNEGFLKEVVSEFKHHGIRTSIFIETGEKLIRNAVKTGTDRIELYTEPFATEFPEDPYHAVLPFAAAARIALEEGLGINAGHDLSLLNLKYFVENVPGVLEVSIGHALISDALYFGLENTIQMYLRQLR